MEKNLTRFDSWVQEQEEKEKRINLLVKVLEADTECIKYNLEVSKKRAAIRYVKECQGTLKTLLEKLSEGAGTRNKRSSNV